MTGVSLNWEVNEVGFIRWEVAQVTGGGHEGNGFTKGFDVVPLLIIFDCGSGMPDGARAIGGAMQNEIFSAGVWNDGYSGLR